MNRMHTDLVDEKVQLDLRRQKLRDFFETREYHALDDRHKTLLSRQLYCMFRLSMILGERIALFEAAATNEVSRFPG